MKEFQDSQGYTEERKKEGKKERKEGMKEGRKEGKKEGRKEGKKEIYHRCFFFYMYQMAP